MRIISVFVLAMLPLVDLATDNGQSTRFNKFHQNLLSTSPFKLDDTSYEQFTAVPRDYTAVVLLTALEAKFGCNLCREFHPEWELIAKSWIKGDRKGDARVLYGTLDFSDGKAVFQKLMLQTAPVVLLFPPTTGPGAVVDGQPIRYDFSSGSTYAEHLYGWITRHLPAGSKPIIQRPFNYVRFVAIITMVLCGITIFSVTSPYTLPVIRNRNLWAAISLIIILLFTSGHMFNHIRKVPYVTGNGKGGVAYFASGFSNQFGMETQIVAAIYGVLSFATIALAHKVPRVANPKQQKLAVLVWGAVMFLMYSFLLSVFKIKNGGYPFHLPPF